jgi:hypothetical protein
METPREYYYTYYSYEEWGRGYFGSRKCYCLPEEDVKYLGSSKDKTFKPTQKIILKSDYKTREEALTDEIILQKYYKVVENPHFANKAYQTSTKFYYLAPPEKRVENAKIGGNEAKELGLGIHALTPEQKTQNGRKGGSSCRDKKVGVFSLSKEDLSKNGKKGGKITGQKHKENKTGVLGRTKEQMSEDGKKGGNKIKELGLGIFSFTPEEKSEVSKKSGKRAHELGVGIHGLDYEERVKNGEKGYQNGLAILSPEEKYENAKKGGNIGGQRCKELKVGVCGLSLDELVELGKKTTSQKWMCLETGFVSNPGGLSHYQKARGIDTSKRKRIS